MCPKFHTNLVFKYTKCHISTNLSKFLKLVDYVAKNYLPLLGLLQQIADSLKKVGLVGILIHGSENKFDLLMQKRDQCIFCV